MKGLEACEQQPRKELGKMLRLRLFNSAQPPWQETAPRDINPVDPSAHATTSGGTGRDGPADRGSNGGPVAEGDPYNRNAGNVELLKVCCEKICRAGAT